MSGVDVVGDLVQRCLDLGCRRSPFCRFMGVFVLSALSDDFNELYFFLSIGVVDLSE